MRSGADTYAPVQYGASVLHVRATRTRPRAACPWGLHYCIIAVLVVRPRLIIAELVP